MALKRHRFPREVKLQVVRELEAGTPQPRPRASIRFIPPGSSGGAKSISRTPNGPLRARAVGIKTRPASPSESACWATSPWSMHS
jgi:hypothetical protein